MKFTQDSLANNVTLDEVLARLSASDKVEGLALFGSRASNSGNPISDYDLLILVSDLPVAIFQMLTHIDGRMADVVFVETETADRVLANAEALAANSFEGMFMLKMQTAQIVYDASGRLARVQQRAQRNLQPPPSTYAALYDAWFWHNHGLVHMKRMAQSDDALYLTAVDMMLLTGLSGVSRAYYTARHLPWQGEKAAIRHLQQHDPRYLALLRECIAAGERTRKLKLYEQLVAVALEPIGALWTAGLSAIYLRDAAQHATHLDAALAWWEEMLGA